MKKQKKLGRKLSLNKVTIDTLNQREVIGGATALSRCPCPCEETVLTETCTTPQLLCPCQYPLTY